MQIHYLLYPFVMALENLVPDSLITALKKQKYHRVGAHSAVKRCKWFYEALTSGRSCYKQRFYGINSHQCIQMSPSLFYCTQQCLFCWRAQNGDLQIRWDEMKLRDNSAKMQFAWEARKSGDLSAKTFLEEFLDIPFDPEVEQMRLEEMSTVLSNPQLDLGMPDAGMGAGYGGAAAAGGGGMVGGGGMPPPPPMPGGDMGAPPAGGGAPPGGAPAAPGAPPAGPSANVLYDNYLSVTAEKKEFSDVIVAGRESRGWHPLFRRDDCIGDGYRGALAEEPDITSLALDVDPISWGRSGFSLAEMRKFALGNGGNSGGSIRAKSFFTSIEQALYKGILSQRYPFAFWAQYMVNGDPRMRVDGAFPQIKLAVEADGRTWHADPAHIQKDKARDSSLAAQGWMVLRFTEEEIEKRLPDVLTVVSRAISQRSQKQAALSAAQMTREAERQECSSDVPEES